MGLEQIVILVIVVVVALLNALAELRNRRRRTPPEPPAAVPDAAPSASPQVAVRRAPSDGARAVLKPARAAPAATRPRPPLTPAEARRGVVLMTILGPCVANARDEGGTNAV